MAEEQYAAYNYKFGYPPKQPSHLIAFAKKQGVRITWGQAKNMIKQAPDTSGYVPPPPKKDGQSLTKPPQRKNTEEKKSEKMEIAKRYSSNNIKIDQKQLFNVGRRNTLQKYSYLLSQLTAMGWDQKQSLEALKATNGNLQLAIEMLMSGEITSGPMITLKKMNQSDNTPNLRKVPKKYNNNSQPQQVTTETSQPQPQTRPTSQSQFQSQSQSYSQPQSKPRSQSQFQSETQSYSQPQSQPQSQYNQLENSTVKNNYSPPPNRVKKNELQLFLNNLALGHYYNNFINYGFGNELTGLNDLNEEILIAMGINIMAHRRAILKGLYGPEYFKQQQQQMQPQSQQQVQPQPPQQTQTNNNNNSIDLDNAFEKLLGGHGSIKQRLRSMDEIFQSLEAMNIETDNGKVLLSAFAEQILHEDYIYREYKVRIKGIETISKIFMHCLNKLPHSEIPNLIDNSLPEIFDNLFLLLDNNRAKQFHPMCKQCIQQIIEAIVNKNNKLSIISLCGLLNEKTNIENINQPHARFYASNLIFQNIIFKYELQLINTMFNFDIERYDNKLIKYSNGIPQNQLIKPNNNLWFQLLTANQWNSNDDETFKDIITDTLSMMILDPNCDISTVGSNVTVYLNSFNNNFRNSLETEAKYRFKKFYVVQPPQQTPMNNSFGMKPMAQQPPQPPVQKQNRQQNNGEVDYRIKQLTAVSVAPPTLPSI